MDEACATHKIFRFMVKVLNSEQNQTQENIMLETRQNKRARE
jgi:hypothetical protein